MSDLDQLRDKLADAMLAYEDLRDEVINNTDYDNDTINWCLDIMDQVAAPFSELVLEKAIESDDKLKAEEE